MECEIDHIAAHVALGAYTSVVYTHGGAPRRCERRVDPACDDFVLEVEGAIYDFFEVQGIWHVYSVGADAMVDPPFATLKEAVRWVLTLP